MTLSAINGNAGNLAMQSMSSAAPGNEAREVGPDHDGDSDDAGSRAVSAAPSPTVNSSGQTTGRMVNITA